MLRLIAGFSYLFLRLQAADAAAGSYVYSSTTKRVLTTVYELNACATFNALNRHSRRGADLALHTMRRPNVNIQYIQR